MNNSFLNQFSENIKSKFWETVAYPAMTQAPQRNRQDPPALQTQPLAFFSQRGAVKPGKGVCITAICMKLPIKFNGIKSNFIGFMGKTDNILYTE